MQVLLLGTKIGYRPIWLQDKQKLGLLLQVAHLVELQAKQILAEREE